MNRSLLPPRGIFIPTQIIFNSQLPSTVLVTWIQLRCLAWRGWSTPPLSISEFASLIGIHPSRLHKHLSLLHDLSTLDYRSSGNGKLIVSFPEEQAVSIGNRIIAPKLSEAEIRSDQNHEPANPPSYFPARILGYLSFSENQADAKSADDSEELFALQVVEEKCY